MHWNGKVDSFHGWTLQKIPKISKNASNGNCAELNFLQKTQWTHISISPRTGARASKDCHFLNIINVLEWESRLTLGLNAAKSTDCIKKCSKQKLYNIKFPIKNLVGVSPPPPHGSEMKNLFKIVIPVVENLEILSQNYFNLICVPTNIFSHNFLLFYENFLWISTNIYADFI